MRRLDIGENELYYILTNMEKVVTGDGDLLIKLYHYIATWVCDYAYMSLFHINRELCKQSNVSSQDINNTRELHFDRFTYAEGLHKRALSLAQNTDSEYARWVQALSDFYLNLAEACLKSGEKDAAKQHYLKGRELRLSLMETEEAAADFIANNDHIYLK